MQIAQTARLGTRGAAELKARLQQILSKRFTTDKRGNLGSLAAWVPAVFTADPLPKATGQCEPIKEYSVDSGWDSPASEPVERR